VSKVSINKYDPYQLKSSIDDEICHVSDMQTEFMVFYSSWKARKASRRTIGTLT
jgi:hypothetical protein